MKPNTEQEAFMLEAIALSVESAKTGGGPFGAVVVKDGAIVGQGSNKVTSSSDPTAHGEIVAIRDACKNLKTFQLTDCDIYTSAEPCPMCLGAIYWARPRAVYYGNSSQDAAEINFDDSFIYDEIDIETHKRTIPFHQIMRDVAQEAFITWTNNLTKTTY